MESFRSLSRPAWVAALFVALLACLAGPRPAWAVDIDGTQPFAFDQPQVNGVLLPAGSQVPYSGKDILDNTTFNVLGFLDTGSSGIVIDSRMKPLFNIPVQAGVTYSDVAIGGNTDFSVTPNLDVRIAPSTASDVDHQATIPTVYNQLYSSTRLQIGPTNLSPDPESDPLNVFGMPVMLGKTVVMDPKPLNSPDLLNFDFMHTFIYNQGTPFNAAAANTNPGIPTTNHHVALSYGDFSRFSQTTPAGAAGPTLGHNPFIGPNPANQFAANPLPDSTPPVALDFGGIHVTGSFLLDTGAVTSFISTKLAADLHVRYQDNTLGTNHPVLELFDPAHPNLPGTTLGTQFMLPIQGIGGAPVLAGFYLDDLVLHTLEGGLVDLDPNNIRYLHAPVMVNDLELLDPNTGQLITLDGVFGMNAMVASALLTADLNIDKTAFGPYNWVTIDEPNSLLGLDLGTQVPEPGSIVLGGFGFLLVGLHVCRKRIRGKERLGASS
jgi:hypothetical protein